MEISKNYFFIKFSRNSIFKTNNKTVKARKLQQYLKLKFLVMIMIKKSFLNFFPRICLITDIND